MRDALYYKVHWFDVIIIINIIALLIYYSVASVTLESNIDDSHSK